MIPGAAVILSGSWLDVVLADQLSALRRASSNGLRHNECRISLVRAIHAAMSATGDSDVRKSPKLQDPRQQKPTVSIAAAAKQMGISERQVRRLAPQLGGQKNGKSWLLDQTAIDEHVEGQNA